MTDELNEIWGLYADEGKQSLEAIEEALLVLKDSPTDTNTISRLFRAMHTFKGNSQVMGLFAIEFRAHIAEDLIGLVRDQGVPLDAELIDLLLEFVDVLHPILSEVCRTKQDAAPDVADELVARMKEKLAACQALKNPQATQTSQPVVENIPLAESTTQKTEAVTFDNSESLVNDPMFREIFVEMATASFQEMQTALAEFDADSESAKTHFYESIQRLQVVAEQVILPEWQSILSEFLAISDVTEEHAKSLNSRLLTLFGRDFDDAPAPVSDVSETIIEEIIESTNAVEEPVSDIETEIETETDAENKPPLAIIFDNSATLANNPMYREIFVEMAHSAFQEMVAAIAEFETNADLARTHFFETSQRLRIVSEQIILPEWLAVLDDYLVLTDAQENEARALHSHLLALFERDFGGDVTPISGVSKDADEVEAEFELDVEIDNTDPNAQFFAIIQKQIQVFARYAEMRKSGDKGDIKKLTQATREIKALAKRFNFLHLVDISDRLLAGEQTTETLHRFEFQLYEGLVAIENTTASTNSNAQHFLELWCADRVFENLLTINNTLDAIKNKQDIDVNCSWITELLREVYYACVHYKLESAAYLCTSLSDLFARVLNDVAQFDAVILHIAKSFIADMELILDNVDSGVVPDMDRIEKLLEEASTATVSTGVLSAKSIETRLNLPKSFHKVLTTESIKAATTALEEGCIFCIIRADLEEDENLACDFLNWIESGAIRAISNVTVFMENRTLFDFLVATQLEFLKVKEILATFDPSSKALFIERELEDRKLGGTEHVPSDDVFFAEPIMSGQGQISSKMLETIGEVVTYQAMVQHLLDEFTKDDLIKTISYKTRELEESARVDINNSLLIWQERLDKIARTEMQMGVLLNQLQEETISGRMRSVNQLLKPLVPFVEALAQKNYRMIDFSLENDEVLLDISMLESLKSPLRALLAFCITQSIETPDVRESAGKKSRGALRVLLVDHDDYVKVIVEDDGIGIDLNRVSQRAAELGWKNEKPKVDMVLRRDYGITSNDDKTYGGLSFFDIKEFLNPIGSDLQIANLPTGGIQFTLSMSLSMLLMDGMVVRVGAVHYIITLDSILHIVRTDDEKLVRLSVENGRYMLKRENGAIIPIHFLKGSHEASKSTNEIFNQDEKHLFVIVMGKEEKCVAIKVDELIGQQNVLSRPLQGYLSHIKGVMGCSLLGSGDVGLVLDINQLFSED